MKLLSRFRYRKTALKHTTLAQPVSCAELWETEMNKDRQIQQRIKQAFERQELDADTRDALGTARQRALEQKTPAWKTGWLPSTAVACLVLVAVAFLALRRDDSSELAQMSADEIAVVTSEDELELYEELEFYIWLDGHEKS